jgi:HNH endonuclease
MANRWRIPADLEREIRKRDVTCVYCGSDFTVRAQSRGKDASWEHIINDETIVTPENIALCCCSCNSSKGNKALPEWLQSAYCKRHGISFETVALVVKNALEAGTSASLLLPEPDPKVFRPVKGGRISK